MRSQRVDTLDVVRLVFAALKGRTLSALDRPLRHLETHTTVIRRLFSKQHNRPNDVLCQETPLTFN